MGELAVAMLGCSSVSGIRSNLPPIQREPGSSNSQVRASYASEFGRDAKGSKSLLSLLTAGKSSGNEDSSDGNSDQRIASRIGSVVGSLVNDRVVSANIGAVADVLADWDDINLEAVEAGSKKRTSSTTKSSSRVAEAESKLASTSSDKEGKESAMSTATVDPFQEQQADQGIWTTWKVRRKKGVEEASRMCIDYILYTPPTDLTSSVNSQDGDSITSSSSSSPSSSPAVSTPRRFRPVGIRAKAVLDLLPAKVVGPALLPSAIYPSDHLAIAADLEIVVFTNNNPPK